MAYVVLAKWVARAGEEEAVSAAIDALIEPSRAEPEAPPRFARGVIAITFAKLWFVIAGYGIFAVLTRMLGPRDFGLYAVVTSIVPVVNNALISVTVRAVARFTARDERSAGSVLRSATTSRCFAVRSRRPSACLRRLASQV